MPNSDYNILLEGSGLTEFGYKIFLDRYALKTQDRHNTIGVGNFVLVKTDQVTGQKEIAVVESITGAKIAIKFVNDNLNVYGMNVSINDIDLPLELTPQQMWDRVATTVASVEHPSIRDSIHNRFYAMMKDWKFVPGGRILAGAGTDSVLTYYNCYVLPSPTDSKIGIFDTLNQMAQIMSRGGGVGINISTLRPRYAPTQSTNGRSSGAVSWGEIYSFVTGLIEQGGSRRGALMLILDDWHPDIEEFIEVKQDMSRITNANISIGISDSFMEAVKKDKEWALIFPDTTCEEYDNTWDGNIRKWQDTNGNVRVHKTVKARELWDKIMHSAWACAEPGIWFKDRANEYSNSQYYAPLVATNPCITGDTKIAVADGRGAVSIQELAELGEDVPVYCYNNGIVVNWGRNPRKTGERVPVWKVILDDGTYIKATKHHKFMMRDGTYKPLYQLWSGDSLMPFRKRIDNKGYTRVKDNVGGEQFEHKIFKEFEIGRELVYPEEVVHHHSFDALHKEAANNHTVKLVKFIGYEDVYNITVDNAHNYAVLTSELEGIVVKNCGEQGLPAWGVCNLGAINLAKFVSERDTLNWAELSVTIHTAVRFLDNVVDITPYYYEENRNLQHSERRLGLGTMGLAELLIRMKLRYGSKKSLVFIDKLYKFIASAAYDASIELAKEKGAFQRYDMVRYFDSQFAKRLPEDIKTKIMEHGIRNVTILTQAPTGTTGTMVNTSTGIEPFYYWKYERKGRLGSHTEVAGVYRDWLDFKGEREFIDDETLELPNWFVTAQDLTPEEHIKVQAAIQRWVDSSISKTCNVPEHYTVGQVKELYELMNELGCKGGTIYRDKSRDVQILNLKEEDMSAQMKHHEVANDVPKEHHTNLSLEGYAKKLGITAWVLDEEQIKQWRKRPVAVVGNTYRQPTPAGSAYITVNVDENGPFEVFVNVGKAGSEVAAEAEAIGRLASFILRMPSQTTPEERLRGIIAQLKGIGSGRPLGFGKNRVMSLPDGIAQVFEVFLGTNGDLKGLPEDEDSTIIGDLCPDCGQASYVRIEGCSKCLNCGFSEC